MITFLRLVVKVVKWSIVAVAYLLVGLAKVVTIVVMLLFLAGRLGVRRLLDAKERRANDDGPEEYDLGYPSHVVAPTPSTRGVSRDAFDARWQRERDLRVAERRTRQTGGRSGSCGHRPVRRRLRSLTVPRPCCRPDRWKSAVLAPPWDTF